MGRSSTKKLSTLLPLALLLLGLAVPPLRAGEVIDRIVATVNGSVILQSDWEEALCYEALLQARPLNQFTPEERRAVLDRLIDQELLRGQMNSADFPHASVADAASRVAQARALYPRASSDAGWQAVLGQYHLTEEDLLARVQQQIDLAHLVDIRLRPTVQIDSKSIEAYYREKFVPQLQQAGADQVPLADVSARIREVLTQEKVGELLVSWLQTLRSESAVRIPGTASSSADQGEQSR